MKNKPQPDYTSPKSRRKDLNQQQHPLAYANNLFSEPNQHAGILITQTRGLYVGRFQPFHNGHLDAIKYALKGVDELIVVIGSAQYSHKSYNPFTAGERLVMVRRALEAASVDMERLWIVPVPDVHLHMLWVSAVEGYTPKFNVVYSNEPLTRRLFMEAGYKLSDLPLFDRKVYNSTLVREKIIKDDSWTTLISKAVTDFIREIDGVNRLRDLARTDKLP